MILLGNVPGDVGCTSKGVLSRAKKLLDRSVVESIPYLLCISTVKGWGNLCLICYFHNYES